MSSSCKTVSLCANIMVVRERISHGQRCHTKDSHGWRSCGQVADVNTAAHENISIKQVPW